MSGMKGEGIPMFNMIEGMVLIDASGPATQTVNFDQAWISQAGVLAKTGGELQFMFVPMDCVQRVYAKHWKSGTSR